ncbi:MAG: hypothetical protein FJX76_19960 [Armatimonadetes bacterium]|nr:hypothetical protein [Armatimonadota bacterium]
MLKDFGAEKTGYRGCLVGFVVGGLIGAVVAFWFAAKYTQVNVPDMPVAVMSFAFGAVGFVVGGILGLIISFVVDLVTRKREKEEDSF